MGILDKLLDYPKIDVFIRILIYFQDQHFKIGLKIVIFNFFKNSFEFNKFQGHKK